MYFTEVTHVLLANLVGASRLDRAMRNSYI